MAAGGMYQKLKLRVSFGARRRAFFPVFLLFFLFLFSCFFFFFFFFFFDTLLVKFVNISGAVSLGRARLRIARIRSFTN